MKLMHIMYLCNQLNIKEIYYYMLCLDVLMELWSSLFICIVATQLQTCIRQCNESSRKAHNGHATETLVVCF